MKSKQKNFILMLFMLVVLVCAVFLLLKLNTQVSTISQKEVVGEAQNSKVSRTGANNVDDSRYQAPSPTTSTADTTNETGSSSSEVNKDIALVKNQNEMPILSSIEIQEDWYQYSEALYYANMQPSVALTYIDKPLMFTVTTEPGDNGVSMKDYLILKLDQIKEEINVSAKHKYDYELQEASAYHDTTKCTNKNCAICKQIKNLPDAKKGGLVKVSGNPKNYVLTWKKVQ